MARYRGAQAVQKRYRGTVPVQRVYRGAVEVWSATYAASGLIVQQTPPSALWVSVASHTMSKSATPFTLSMGVMWANPGNNNSQFGIEIRKNSTRIAYSELTGTDTPRPHNLSVTSVTLASGDVIDFRVYSGLVTASLREILSGTWSIVQNT